MKPPVPAGEATPIEFLPNLTPFPPYLSIGLDQLVVLLRRPFVLPQIWIQGLPISLRARIVGSTRDLSGNGAPARAQ